MKIISKKIKLITIILFASSQIYAQQINQVIFASGGIWGASGNKTMIGAYDPVSEQYGIFDSMPGNFTNDVMVSGNMAYVIVDGQLVKYSIDTYERLAKISIPGANRLADYGSLVIVTKGFGATDTNYVQAFNKNNLSLAFSINNIGAQCAGIAVVGDTAYVAVPGSYGDTVGSLALVNLNTQTLASKIDLDTMGVGIKEVLSNGTAIVAVSSKFAGFDVVSGAVHYYNTLVDSIVSKEVNIPISGGTALVNDTLYCNLNNTGIGRYNLTTLNIIDTTLVAGFFVGSKIDKNNKRIYATSTDYASFGQADFYTIDGVNQGNFDIGIAPTGIDFDYRTPVANKKPVAFNDGISTEEDSLVLVAVTANDFDLNDDTLTVSLDVLPVNGAVLLMGNNIQYTPNAGFFGVDSFSYAVCDNGTGTLCDTAWVKVTVNKYTGIRSIGQANGINIYPNPTNSMIEINMSTVYNKITLLDLTGRVIIQKTIAANTKNTRLDLSQFASGTYMLKLENETNVSFQRIVKN